MTKITVLGDIMSESCLMEAVKGLDGTYDYASVFAPLAGLLAEADLRVANFETPCAGEAAVYAQNIYDFNAPDDLAKAVKTAGFDAVSFANNHVFDRGIEGLLRTLTVLSENGLITFGASASPDGEKTAFVSAGSLKIALVSSTYGTNKKPKTDEEAACVNYLRPVHAKPTWVLPKDYVNLENFVTGLLGRRLNLEERTQFKKLAHVDVAHSDEHFFPAEYEKELTAMEEEIRRAKEKADLVLFLPHTGGQFNTVPGSFSAYVTDRAVRAGADAVLAAHSHTTQKAEYLRGVPVFYSLGNVSMMHTFYSVTESLPDLGIASHLYLDGAKIAKVTFSLIKMLEEDGTPLRVWPVDELYQRFRDDPKKQAALFAEAKEVFMRITGRDGEGFRIEREYAL